METSLVRSYCQFSPSLYLGTMRHELYLLELLQKRSLIEVVSLLELSLRLKLSQGFLSWNYTVLERFKQDLVDAESLLDH
nr:hypothetical protein CFP56_20508 [Quercus suber]